jgi:hypothetical protein
MSLSISIAISCNVELALSISCKKIDTKIGMKIDIVEQALSISISIFDSIEQPLSISIANIAESLRSNVAKRFHMKTIELSALQHPSSNYARYSSREFSIVATTA